VAAAFPDMYLVGGTAISLQYHHRLSEDLDFFMQAYSRKRHREAAAWIKRQTGFACRLVDEEIRKKYLPMAVYEFETPGGHVLKVDFVKDFARLIGPRQPNGMASNADIYYRKLMAVMGWKAAKSRTGILTAGGRQKTKDLYDVYFLSKEVSPLCRWFSSHFGPEDYERLAAWYLHIPKQRAVMELMDLVPGCDAKDVFRELDDQILYRLNREYGAV